MRGDCLINANAQVSEHGMLEFPLVWLSQDMQQAERIKCHLNDARGREEGGVRGFRADENLMGGGYGQTETEGDLRP